MIAALSGTVSEKLPDKVIIDVAGVGYGVYVSNEDYGVMQTGKEVKLSIYEHLREQSHDLFGFIKRDSQNLFEKLLDVNGIGPKMALNMLSIGSLTSIIEAIASGDIKYIQQASGVGKRVAERVIIELRDKVGIDGNSLSTNDILSSSPSSSNDEAVQALISLGYTGIDASNALKNVDKKLPTEERIKLALKG
jgi:Holliday junction DNA helicase RuvA